MATDQQVVGRSTERDAAQFNLHQNRLRNRQDTSEALTDSNEVSSLDIPSPKLAAPRRLAAADKRAGRKVDSRWRLGI